MKKNFYVVLGFLLLAVLNGASLAGEAQKKINITSGMLTASSTYDGYTPITAFDGNFSNNTGWCASGGQKTGWIIVDFKGERNITNLRLQPDRWVATDSGSSYLSAFRIDIWANNSWQSISPLIQTPKEKWYSVDINKKVGKIRVWCESTGNGPQVKEIEIYQF